MLPLSIAVALIGGLSSSTAAQGRAHAASSGDRDFARRVAITGGRRIYLECRGTGTPTVVLEAGTGDRSDVRARRH